MKLAREIILTIDGLSIVQPLLSKTGHINRVVKRLGILLKIIFKFPHLTIGSYVSVRS